MYLHARTPRRVTVVIRLIWHAATPLPLLAPSACPGRPTRPCLVGGRLEAALAAAARRALPAPSPLPSVSPSSSTTTTITAAALVSGRDPK